MDGIPKDAREVYLGEGGRPIAFCPKEGLGLTDLTRVELYRLNKDRLHQLCHRAAEKGPDFVAICIDVEDPAWNWMVDVLMPGADWQQYRDRGEHPVARGVVPRRFVETVVTELYPAALPLPAQTFAAVFAAGGMSAFTLE